MRAKWIVGVIATAAVVGGGFAYWKFYRAEASKPAAAQYATEAVRRGNLRVETISTGSVVGKAQVDVRVEVAGTVRALKADVGDRVKQGDPLMILSSDDLLDQVQQTRIDLQMAELKLQEMKNPSKKPAEADIALARQRVEQGRLALESRKAEQPNLTVTSQGAGEVTKVAVHPGDTVSSGALIAQLETTDRLAFIFPVQQSSLEHLRVGQKASMTVGGRNIGRQGIVREIPSQGVQGNNGLVYNVKIEIDNADLGVVRPGMSGYVVIDTRPQGEYILEGKGTVDVWDRYEVRARASGRVEEVLVQEGNPVQAGQAVARLSNDNLPTQIRQAEIDLQTAELNLQNLLNPENTNTDADIRQQELRIEQLRLTLVQKERDLSKLTVRAPIDGTVVQRNANLGDRVAAGGSGTAPFVVADYSKMSVELSVDELDVGKLREGLGAQITIDALPGQQFKGTVAQINPAGTVSQGVATFGVLVAFEPSKQVIPGMTANVRILVDERKDVLMAPIEAVQKQRGRQVVRRLPAGATQTSGAAQAARAATAQPETVEVKTGLANDTHVEIVSGLNEGDQVVVGQVTQQQNRGPGIPVMGGPGGPGGGGLRPGGFGGGGGRDNH